MSQALVLFVLARIGTALGQVNSNVVPTRAKLMGFSETALRENGGITALRVTGNVEVIVAGTYKVIFQLASAHGRSLTGNARGHLDVGPQTLTAFVGSNEIHDVLAEDGPYRIFGAYLYLETGINTSEFAGELRDSGLTLPYRLSELHLGTFSSTDEVEAEKVDPTPAGKFTKLRFRFGVVTPGGACSWWGTLADQGFNTIDFEHGVVGASLPPGRSLLTLDFAGFAIARRKIDGPLAVRTLTLECGGKERILTYDPIHLSGNFRSVDFDNPDPDLEFVIPSKAVRIAAGDAVMINVPLRSIGGLDPFYGQVLMQADNLGIQFLAPNSRPCPNAFPCWLGEYLGYLQIQTAADLLPGTYVIRVSAPGIGKKPAAEVPFIVDPDLTAKTRKRAEALARVLQEDAPPPPTPAIQTAPAEELHPDVTFSTNVGLRKIHAVLILDRSGSMFGSCDFMRGAARRFSRLFTDQRDSIGVISYSENVQLLVPLTDHFQPDAADRISKITCQGSTNTAEALEVAHQELARLDDPEATNVLILFTDGGANALSANWQLKDPAEKSCGGRSCARPPACVAEVQQGGGVPAVLEPLYGGPGITDFRFAVHPALVPGPAAAHVRVTSCADPMGVTPFAFIPEQDVWGTSVAGSHPLERFADGPYAGRIQLSLANLPNAFANEMENVARALRSGPPVYIYLIGFVPNKPASAMESLDYFMQLTNDPAGVRFDRDQPEGLTIVTENPEDFWPAFQRVREEIIKHATVK
jgi:hypothetical protein